MTACQPGLRAFRPVCVLFSPICCAPGGVWRPEARLTGSRGALFYAMQL